MDAEVKSPEFWVNFVVPVGSTLDTARIPTLHDIQEKDGDGIAPLWREVGDIRPEPRMMPYAPYFEQKFVDLEVEHIWRKLWQVACRDEDIPNVGDRISYDIVHDSYFVVRTAENEFKAYHNVCRHRGRKLCEGLENGDIRCPFHGWTYTNEGNLKWLPFEQEFPALNRDHHKLVEVQCDTWGGNIFINPDPKASPLADSLGPLTRHFATYPQEERYTAFKVIVHANCNWKTNQEAFQEGYHVVQTHADGMPMFGSVATQVDCFSEGKGFVSRVCTPGMTTDTYLIDDVTPKEGLVLFCKAYDLPLPPEDRGNDPVDARKYAADETRKRIETMTGKDWSKEPVSYFIDMAKYFMFPNHHPWWGEGLPWWYKFTPYRDDPTKSVLEFRMLLPIPADGKRPPVPEALVVDFGQKAESYAELGAVGHIMDQDVANMEACQLGMMAAPKGINYATTSHYQEQQITRFYEIYDELLGLDSDD